MLQHELKKWFGFEDFKPGQQEIIESVLNNEDTLGILPTGSGKSLCYQLPT
ncbi:MAG: DEAD/DEAH box helicase, partial [Staphylococcus equorum]